MYTLETTVICYMCLKQEELFGITESGIPDIEKINGLKDLITRTKQCKEITCKRISESKVAMIQKSER